MYKKILIVTNKYMHLCEFFDYCVCFYTFFLNICTIICKKSSNFAP